MSNSERTITYKLPDELYDRLTTIKDKYNCTYSEVISKLVTMEQKNNIIYEVGDYEYITENGEYPFRILFKTDENIIEFLTNKGYCKDKKYWDIPARDKSMFSKFINKPETFEMLRNMGIALEYPNFIILKL